jgi:translation initiation factor IF-3
LKISREFGPRVPSNDGPRINREIRAHKIRLIDADGEMIGVVSTPEALRKAEEAGLDLVEISPNSDPPVCKILDYGKFKYEEQKRKAESKKKQKVIEVKEIKIRPSIEDHDYQVKLRSMMRFFEEGDRVKVSMRFRGREIDHQDIGLGVLRRICDDVSSIAKIEQHPKVEGKQAVMLLSPVKAS